MKTLTINVIQRLQIITINSSFINHKFKSKIKGFKNKLDDINLIKPYRDTEKRGKPKDEIMGKNIKLKGKRHKSGVVFDNYGFPIFDDYIKYECIIPPNIRKIRTAKLHKCTATRDLYMYLRRLGTNFGFNRVQLHAIKNGIPHIPGYIWHHHQDLGRMQLVPKKIHNKTGHIGGMRLWFYL